MLLENLLYVLIIKEFYQENLQNFYLLRQFKNTLRINFTQQKLIEIVRFIFENKNIIYVSLESSEIDSYKLPT